MSENVFGTQREPGREPGGLPNILLVEDDEAVREALTALLEQEGFQVSVAVNGSDALELLQSAASTQPELVISDVAMPVMNGLTLIGRMRAIGISIPVLLMSAAMGRPRDYDGPFLAKPFDFDRLLEAIGAALSRPI